MYLYITIDDKIAGSSDDKLKSMSVAIVKQWDHKQSRQKVKGLNSPQVNSSPVGIFWNENHQIHPGNPRAPPR